MKTSLQVVEQISVTLHHRLANNRPMPTDLLYYHDAYQRSFRSRVVAVDADANAVALAETAFFPTGGGQPNDLGTLTFDGVVAEVVDVVKGKDGHVWHALAAGATPP